MRLEGFLNSNFNERVGLSVCGAPDTSAIRNALSACVLSIVRLAMSINSRLHCFYGKTTQATGSTILSHLPAAPVLSQRKSDVTLSVANHKVNQAQWSHIDNSRDIVINRKQQEKNSFIRFSM